MGLPSIWIIEGIDRCSKSTLIKNLVERAGMHTVIHSSKPPVIERYKNEANGYGPLLHDGSVRFKADASIDQKAQVAYQFDYFANLFTLARTPNVKIIFDRLHLGEMVYSPLYRNATAPGIMDLEHRYLNHDNDHIRLILMTEDFSVSKHFVSDGDSFDDTKRQEEQNMFLRAFNKSVIKDKRIINVTAPDGNFRSEHDILIDALV